MAVIDDQNYVVSDNRIGGYNQRNDRANFVNRSNDEFLRSEKRFLTQNLLNLKKEERKEFGFTNYTGEPRDG